MDNRPKRVLRQLIDRYGPELNKDPRRLEGLLADFCGEHQREIFVLIHAQRMGAPHELLQMGDQRALPTLQQRLSRRMQDRYAFSQEAADWAIQSWAEALGLTARPPLVVRLLHGAFALVARAIRRTFARARSKPGKPGGDRSSQSVVQWARKKGFRREKLGGLAALLLGFAVIAALAAQWENVIAVARDGNPLAFWQEQTAAPADPEWKPPSIEEAGAEIKQYYPPPQQAQIAADLLNVRETPALNGTVIGRVGPQGAQVTLLDYSPNGKWARIDAPVAGWISTDYIVLESAGAADRRVFLRPGVNRVVQPGLQVFAEPETTSEGRDILAAGQLVLQMAVTTDGVWTRLAFPSEGWVRTSGLQPAEQE